MALVEKLNWMYVAIIYTDEAYGKEGSQAFIERAISKGICIAHKEAIDRDYDHAKLKDMIETLVHRAGNTQYGTLGVVYFGQLGQAKAIVRVASLVENSHRLIWIMSDAVGTNTQLYKEHPRIGKNTFVLTANYKDIHEFQTYWVDTLHNATTDVNFKKEEPLLRQHIQDMYYCKWGLKKSEDGVRCEELSKEDIKKGYTQSAYLNTILDAVYVWVNALKRLHKKHCGESSHGMCENVISAIQTNIYQELLKTNFTYPADFTYVPEAFTLLKRKVRFNVENGNIMQDHTLPAYLIHKYTCTNGKTCGFEKVNPILLKNIHHLKKKNTASSL